MRLRHYISRVRLLVRWFREWLHERDQRIQEVYESWALNEAQHRTVLKEKLYKDCRNRRDQIKFDVRRYIKLHSSNDDKFKAVMWLYWHKRDAFRKKLRSWYGSFHILASEAHRLEQFTALGCGSKEQDKRLVEVRGQLKTLGTTRPKFVFTTESVPVQELVGALSKCASSCIHSSPNAGPLSTIPPVCSAPILAFDESTSSPTVESRSDDRYSLNQSLPNLRPPTNRVNNNPILATSTSICKPPSSSCSMSAATASMLGNSLGDENVSDVSSSSFLPPSPKAVASSSHASLRSSRSTRPLPALEIPDEMCPVLTNASKLPSPSRKDGLRCSPRGTRIHTARSAASGGINDELILDLDSVASLQHHELAATASLPSPTQLRKQYVRLEPLRPLSSLSSVTMVPKGLSPTPRSPSPRNAAATNKRSEPFVGGATGLARTPSPRMTALPMENGCILRSPRRNCSPPLTKSPQHRQQQPQTRSSPRITENAT